MCFRQGLLIRPILIAVGACILALGCASGDIPGRTDPFSWEGTARKDKAKKPESSRSASKAEKKKSVFDAFRSDAFSGEGTKGAKQPLFGSKPSTKKGAELGELKETRTGAPTGFGISVYTQLWPLMDQQNFGGAVDLLRQTQDEFGNKDRLLYLLETGLTSLYAREFDSSRNVLTEAERLDEDLYTKSLTVQATTFIVNDLTAPYRGEDFESVMINLFLALAYLEENDVEGALVEARKIDSKLGAINAQYPEDKRNVYKEDAFARWLMGMLYQINPTPDNLNDAFVSYRKALEIYERDYLPNYRTPPPELLQQQYLSLAQWAGRDDFTEARAKLGQLPFVSLAQQKQGTLITLVHFNGKCPVKVERSITSPLPDGHIIKMAFPEYMDRPYAIADSELRVRKLQGEGEYQARSQLGAPIAGIAYQNLENRKTRVVAKAMVRAAAKYAASKIAEEQVRKQYGDFAALLTRIAADIYMVLSEKADLRAWQTLPAEIRVAQVLVSPGAYSVEANARDRSGRVVETIPLGEVTAEPGGKIFFTLTTTR